MAPIVALDARLFEQQELAESISRLSSNLKKTPTERRTRALYAQRKRVLSDYWHTFFSTHRKLLQDKDIKDTEYYTGKVFDVTEAVYFEIDSYIDDKIAEFDSKASASPETATQKPTTTKKVTQLPNVELPTFHGDHLEWEGFKDHFLALVHDDESVSPVEKFFYLKACLKGEAAEVIKNIRVTANNYPGAWDDLTHRYGNEYLMSEACMHTLFTYKTLTNASPTDLRKLLDGFKQCIRTFTALGKPVHAWDEIFVFALIQKLDRTTRVAWRTSQEDQSEIPTFQSLADFLDGRIDALTADQHIAAASTAGSEKAKTSQRRASYATTTTTKDSPGTKCLMCSGSHTITYCKRFKQLTDLQRKEQAIKLKLCLNCLKFGHHIKDCNSKFTCFKCQAKHHTFLHDAFSRRDKRGDTSGATPSLGNSFLNMDATPFDPSANPPTTSSSCNVANSADQIVFLSTAQVKLTCSNGASMVVRALLDSASDSSFVSEWIVQHLDAPTEQVNVAVGGVLGCDSGRVKKSVQLTLSSPLDSTFALPLRALVVPKPAGTIPTVAVPVKPWKHLQGLTPADPGFAKPGRIDAIIGADLYGFLMLDDTRRGSLSEPVAKATPFGWVIMGSSGAPKPRSSPTEVQVQASHACSFNVSQFWELEPSKSEESAPVTHYSLHTAIQNEEVGQHVCVNCDLQRFWTLEEVSTDMPLTEEELRCETHFKETHCRNDSGRFIVQLPFKEDPISRLAPSRSLATKLFMNCESRLLKNAELRTKYAAFMQDYIDQNHMSVSRQSSLKTGYFLPHHGVFKPGDPNKKIRVVFNASSCTRTGWSLNDCLMTGPKLQSDLWMILTRWRLHKIAFTTDIVQMFRQIKVDEKDVIWQSVLWRSRPDQNLEAYTLNTVTYGTACAPYLALRALRQLAEDERDRFPIGAQIIERGSYVDDFFAGANDIPAACQVKKQLVDILTSGGFQVSKWASNCSELTELENTVPTKILQDVDTRPTLGLLWNPREDTLSFNVASPDSYNATAPTKRSVLSHIAKLFDPLGWLAPVTISAKILMQDTWLAGLQWDEVLPEELSNLWQTFCSSWSHVKQLKVNRWLSSSPGSQNTWELHAFCDASDRAYAAAVYIRVIAPDNPPHPSLLVAKSKVAPVQTVSIPRLELCGALLLARLVKKILHGLGDLTVPVFAWCDSRVALAWIAAHPSKWSPFVAHRVAEIQGTLKPSCWHYVPSAQNPADSATRGLTALQLLSLDIWWKGPTWLATDTDLSLKMVCLKDKTTTQELKRAVVVHAQCQQNQEITRALAHVIQTTGSNSLLVRFSSLSRLLRLSSLCLRFLHNLRHHHDRIVGPVTSLELASALQRWVKFSQQQYFSDEIALILKSKEIKKKSTILSLKPFLDQKEILRVGGRLQESLLSFDEQHPMIISNQCYFARLLILDAHLTSMHGGPQLTMSVLVRKFWIIRGRALVKSVIRGCVICARHSPKPLTQVMGNLPPARVSALRPFLVTGVDFAGPIQMRTTKGRGHKSCKGYICVLVCFTSKAIHLEAVSDLSSQAFLAAFRRFTARRGPCQTLVSDNATNFRGADKEITAMFKAASQFYKTSAAALAMIGTDWTFIPPSSPHFGGLWEAGVKSVKYHLRRVVGTHTLTYEELSTVLCQIEACLNSRPLYQISTEANDIAPLTPGHFIMGHAPQVLPEPGFDDFNRTPTSRWKLLSQMRDHFWRRWQQEYIHTLQQRTKWQSGNTNAQVNSIVLLMEDNSPPATWPLGRIVEVHPGRDGLIRVATIQTAKTTFVRPITKLCLLPTAPN